MQLNKHLVLFRFILKQFGYDDFESLRDEFNNKQTGYDATGRSYFVGSLLGAPKTVSDLTLLTYDDAIRVYEEKLRVQRAETKLSFKYFQWFSLLFTEYYFDRLSTDKNKLLSDLNSFKNIDIDFTSLEDYVDNDLRKLAYWMATGSGKTLIMHCNYWQITKYFRDWENIILITPNEGLSQQHYEELKESGIDAKLYSGSEESLKTKEGEILLIEITKLTKEKEGEGVSVDVDYFSESKNLVFIDEGHKGQRSEEKKWKSLREHITRSTDSFTFEYSATFGQIITNSTKDLLQEYSRSIIFDYSYRHFYADGYGKDFSVFNIEADDDYSYEQSNLLLSAGLLSYYEQLILFDKYHDELRKYNIEKPLWIFVGSRVISGSSNTLTKKDKQNISDVTRVIKFLSAILSFPSLLQSDIDKILSSKSGLINSDGDDIFKNRFEYLRKHKPNVDDILTRIFNGSGKIEAYQIKQAEGEIALRTATSDKYFAVINIGDVAKYSNKLEEDTEGELTIKEDNFTNSLFQNISESASTINILIGSKKFIEGWNSWRVSCMGLLNMGKSEGTQIIQLFGRGVRLKGKDYSLKRENESAEYQIRALQTISIFGLNASYMNSFLTNIEKETPEYFEYLVDIRFNQHKNWNDQIITLKNDKKHNFKEYLVELKYIEGIANRVTLDLRSKIMVADGAFNNQVAEAEVKYSSSLLNEFFEFIDVTHVLNEAKRFCLIRGFTNLIIREDVIIEIIQKLKPDAILCNEGQFGIQEAVNGRIQRVAESAIKEYIHKFYTDMEKDNLTKNLSVDTLTYEKYPEVFPDNKKLIIKVPKEERAIIEELLNDIEKFYKEDIKEIPTLHFDKHLYSPIAVYKKGRKYQDIKTIPIKLNEGETKFVDQLRSFVREHPEKFKDTEIYLLRNLSQRGIGFFLESSSFFPDFILWIIKGSKQYLLLLDPKGIRMMGNFNDPKITFCTSQIAEINKAVQEKIKKENKDYDLELKAFILSISDYDKIKNHWGTKLTPKEEFIENNVLFIEDDKQYINQILFFLHG